MKAIIWDEATQGMKFEYDEIPADLRRHGQGMAREDGRGGGRSERRADEEVSRGGEADRRGNQARHLRQRTIANEIVPMLCGSAFKNKGVQAMLDAVIDYLPSPVDIPPILGHDENDKQAERHSDDDEPFSALAFKIMTDPFVGQLIFFRVYSGVVNSGDTVYNPIKEKKERLGRILQMHANERKEIKEVYAGDIAAAVGLKEATTGDTLCDPNNVDHPRKDDLPGAGDLAGRRAEDEGRPGKDGHRAEPSGAGRSVVPRADRRRIRPDDHLAAWASCTSKFSSTG